MSRCISYLKKWSHFFVFRGETDPTRVVPYMGVSKNRGTPQIIHFNRVFHYFHHPFWGFPPYFWKHPYTLNNQFRCFFSISSLLNVSSKVLPCFTDPLPNRCEVITTQSRIFHQNGGEIKGHVEVEDIQRCFDGHLR